MSGTKLAGGPTQDEIMAISLLKLDLRSTDSVLEIGCGTGKVTVAMAGTAQQVTALDLRPEAIDCAKKTAQESKAENIDFFCGEASDFLKNDRIYDCAFIGGTKHLTDILPVLAGKVRRNIVINAVLVSTLADAISTLQRLGIFCEVVQVQVARSHPIAGSVMFRPVNPVFIITARGTAC
jgi:cobalt-precorrin-6B (C15)-methyltransferase